MATRKQSSLLTNFGLTSKKLHQNVGEKLVRVLQLTFMLVHRLASTPLVRLHCNTGALVRGRPPDGHRVFCTLETSFVCESVVNPTPTR